MSQNGEYLFGIPQIGLQKQNHIYVKYGALLYQATIV